MEEIDNTQWIEDFLDGNLSESDLKRFNERLSSDPEFEKEVKAQRMVRESFERAELKEFFVQINEKVESSEQVRVEGSFSIRILAIAASVTLLIGVSWFFLFKQTAREFDKTEFVAQSFVIMVTLDSMRGISDEVNVEMIQSDQFENHYSFNNDQLKLYLKNSNISPSEIKIFYDKDATNTPYAITIQGKEYALEENSGPEPKPLLVM